MLGVPKWQVSELEAAWVDSDRRKCPCPWFVIHSNHCLSVLLSSTGTSGVSLSHNFYSGSIFKSNSIRTSLSPQRLPPQWLEFTRFYNCGSRVSTDIFVIECTDKWGYCQPLGA